MDTSTFISTLWPLGNAPTSPQVYALLDGARDDRIAPSVWRSGLPHACLYAGSLSPALRAAAPYLVQLAPEYRLTRALVEDGWGRAWGIFLVAQPDVTLPELRRHFRALLRVRDESGRVLVFRFYDPRVLRLYLPTCTAGEKAQVFGRVDTLACESDGGDALLRYRSGVQNTRPPRRADGVDVAASQTGSVLGIASEAEAFSAAIAGQAAATAGHAAGGLPC